jgi:hypothetical protein
MINGQFSMDILNIQDEAEEESSLEKNVSTIM